MRQLTRLLRYLLPYLLQLITGSLMLAAVGLLFTFRLVLLRPILDRVLNPSSGSGDIQLLAIPAHPPRNLSADVCSGAIHNVWSIIAYALVLSSLLKGICDYAGTYLVNHAGYGMITGLRNDCRIHSQAVFRIFPEHSTGTLTSTIVNDIERVQFAMSSVLPEFLEQFFTFAFTAYVGSCSRTSTRVAPGGVCTVHSLFSLAIGMRVRHTTRRGQDQLADVQNILQETITGNRIVKAFSMEAWEIARFRNAARKLFRANMRSVAASAVSSPLMDIFGAIAVALLLAFGRDQVKSGYMSLGIFAAFIGLVFSLYNPVRKFAMFYNNFQQALGASSEIFKFMDVSDEVQEKPNALSLPPFSKSIGFDDVTFCYESDGVQRQVLHHIQLEVKAGEILALVGSSGAGKSTLVSLVPRFFDVTTGRIVIDGHDIRDVTLNSLRSQIGVVTQETVLFNDTLRNNIAYGQPAISQASVEAAAHAALAHDFIMELPAGYETVIGEKGVRLSGGERQRIAIARALLKNAPILILDEATSALDSESESLVQSALQNLMSGRTVVVIAHRLSTVRRADRIVVIENGSIADIGTHEELMQKLGTYRRLYDLQFIDVEQPRPVAQPQEAGKF